MAGARIGLPNPNSHAKHRLHCMHCGRTFTDSWWRDAGTKLYKHRRKVHGLK